jgi:hypothetical protein
MNRRSLLAAFSLGSGCFLSLPAIARTLSPRRRGSEPDGSGWRARIGVLTRDDDAVPESEFWTMTLCSGLAWLVCLATSNILDPGPTTQQKSPKLPLASIVLPSRHHLSSRSERRTELTARLEKRSEWIPVTCQRWKSCLSSAPRCFILWSLTT